MQLKARLIRRQDRSLVSVSVAARTLRGLGTEDRAVVLVVTARSIDRAVGGRDPRMWRRWTYDKALPGPCWPCRLWPRSSRAGRRVNRPQRPQGSSRPTPRSAPDPRGPRRARRRVPVPGTGRASAAARHRPSSRRRARGRGGSSQRPSPRRGSGCAVLRAVRHRRPRAGGERLASNTRWRSAS